MKPQSILILNLACQLHSSGDRGFMCFGFGTKFKIHGVQLQRSHSIGLILPAYFYNPILASRGTETQCAVVLQGRVGWVGAWLRWGGVGVIAVGSRAAPVLCFRHPLLTRKVDCRASDCIPIEALPWVATGNMG